MSDDRITDEAVEAAARRTWRDEHGSINSPDELRTPESDEAERDRTGYRDWDKGRVSLHVKEGYRHRARAALTAALPHLAPVGDVDTVARLRAEVEIERMRKYAPSPQVEALLEKSTLGSDEAEAARDSVSPDIGRLIVRLSEVMADRDAAVADRDRLVEGVRALLAEIDDTDTVLDRDLTMRLRWLLSPPAATTPGEGNDRG